MCFLSLPGKIRKPSRPFVKLKASNTSPSFSKKEGKHNSCTAPLRVNSKPGRKVFVKDIPA